VKIFDFDRSYCERLGENPVLEKRGDSRSNRYIENLDIVYIILTLIHKIYSLFSVSANSKEFKKRVIGIILKRKIMRNIKISEDPIQNIFRKLSLQEEEISEDLIQDLLRNLSLYKNEDAVCSFYFNNTEKIIRSICRIVKIKSV
jgi:hypothetical protein